jgi:hypothetical protein
MERLPVDTIVAPMEHDEVIREAILRELNREGQVYFLHNRVPPSTARWRSASKLVPEARIEVTAHGQMDEDQLSLRHARLRARRVRCAAVHHHHRERARHPQRQHHFHRPRRPLRPGRAVPAPRPRGPLQAQGLRLPAAARARHAAPPRGPQAHRRHPALPSLGAGFKLACATWKSAARATCSGGETAERPHRRRRYIEEESSISTASCSN